MGGSGLTTAPVWCCLQGIPTTQPSLLPWDAACARSGAPEATQPHHTAGSMEQDPHPAPLPPTPARFFSFTSHFPLLLFFAASPAAPAFSSPSITHPTPHLLSHSFSQLSPYCISTKYLPPHLISIFLLASFSQLWTSWTPRRKKKVPKKKPQTGRSLPLYLWALPFLKCRDFCAEHLQSPLGLSKGGHAVGLVVVDTPVPGLANNLYSYTRLDSHLPLQSPRAATHAWDPGFQRGATGSAKVRGASEI